MNQAEVSRLVSKLRVKILPRHRNMQNSEGLEGRLKKLRQTVTALIKYERLELHYNRADEARGYAERLISEAIRHGDTHKPTMEMASFWLEEKQLVHKLFKVLVPRFENYQIAYTALYKAPKKYPDDVFPFSVLELRGNPFPPLIRDGAWNKNLIHNILLEEARREYRKEKYAEIAARVTSSEKQQKLEQGDQENEIKSKAAQDVSEGEELLKCDESSEKTEQNESDSQKPLPVV